jgi:predicted metal-binding membrane protein
MDNQAVLHQEWRGRLVADRSSRRAFFGATAMIFAASVAVTIVWCESMSDMGEMAMPGGWTMSMAWMRMPGQTWLGAAASFLGMWTVMMVAMMLPSLVPALWRYRQALVRTGEAHVGRLATLAGLAYFSVWALIGLVAFPLGVALAGIEMHQPLLSRAVPVMVGIVVIAGGAIQLTSWKARRLACCRETLSCGRSPGATPAGAWRHGLRLGRQCIACCANLMVIPLAVGMMDLSAMAAVALAVTVERVAPASDRFARAIGAVVIGTGLLLILRAR